MTNLRTGPHKRWSAKFLKTELDKRLLDPQGRTDVSSFARKVNDEIVAWSHGEQLRWPYPSLRLEGLRTLRLESRSQLSGLGSDVDALARSVAFRCLDKQIWTVVFDARVASGTFDRRVQVGGMFKDLMTACAMLTAAGWLHQARALCAKVPGYLAARHLMDADPEATDKHPWRRPFAWFTLRLLADWAGLALPARLPHHPYPAPAYDAVLACWRDPDPAVLVEPLLAACDWHTHECMYSRSDAPHKDVDFIDDSLMGWPLEVHMVYRLREALGLALPGPLDHPLMQTPLAEYRPPWPQPQDPLWLKVRARALREFPGLEVLL